MTRANIYEVEFMKIKEHRKKNHMKLYFYKLDLSKSIFLAGFTLKSQHSF